MTDDIELPEEDAPPIDPADLPEETDVEPVDTVSTSTGSQ